MGTKYDAILGRLREKDSGGGGGGGDIAISDVTGLTNALASKISTSEKNAANGVPGLDENGKVSSTAIPIATTSTVGGGKIASTRGVYLGSSNEFSVYPANVNAINARLQNYQPIVPAHLEYAVRSVSPLVTEIPSATTAYDLLDATATTNDHSWCYRHAPTSAPTYTLPTVTDATMEHCIVLDVDFTTVQTCAFEDTSGNTITPLNSLSIQSGDIVEYLCKYDAIQSKWCIVASFLNKPNAYGS